MCIQKADTAEMKVLIYCVTRNEHYPLHISGHFPYCGRRFIFQNACVYLSSTTLD